MTTSLFPFVLVPALTDVGVISPAAKMAFYLTGTTTLATVYDEDGDPISQVANGAGVVGVEADAFGRFPSIYLDDSVVYRVRLRTALGAQLGSDVDPYSAATGANGNFSATKTYPIGSVGAKLRNIVSITDAPFNAKVDGTTDDTAAIQAAIDYCLTFDPPKSLSWPAGGFSKTTATLNIDRLVDTTTCPFHIFGNGGGIIPIGNITAVGTTLRGAGDADPQSEEIAFHSFNVEGDPASTTSYAYDWRFLRIAFLGKCRVRNMKVVKSPHYIQDWFIHKMTVRDGWTGWAFDAVTNYYNCDFRGLTFENAATGDCIRSSGGGLEGSRIIGVLAEGVRAFFFQAGGNATVISDCYLEGNTGQEFVLADAAQGGVSRGIVFQGNSILCSAGHTADPAYYPVLTGDTRGLQTGGNYCNYQMYDNTGMTSEALDVSADIVANTFQIAKGLGTGLTDAARTGPIRPIIGKDGTTPFGAIYATMGPIWSRFGIVGKNVPLAGYQVNPEGVAGSEITVTHGPANPQSGYFGSAQFAKGSVVWNSSPDAGEAAGWVCSVAGAPGTWLTVGRTPTMANSTAGTLAALVADFNTLLSQLR